MLFMYLICGLLAITISFFLEWYILHKMVEPIFAYLGAALCEFIKVSMTIEYRYSVLNKNKMSSILLLIQIILQVSLFLFAFFCTLNLIKINGEQFVKTIFFDRYNYIDKEIFYYGLTFIMTIIVQLCIFFPCEYFVRSKYNPLKQLEKRSKELDKLKAVHEEIHQKELSIKLSHEANKSLSKNLVDNLSKKDIDIH